MSSSETLWLLNHRQIAQWHASQPLFLLLLFPTCAALGTSLSYSPQGLHSLSWPLGLLGRGTEGQVGCSHLWAGSMCATASQPLDFLWLYWPLMGRVILINYVFVQGDFSGRLCPDGHGAACCQDCPGPSFASLMAPQESCLHELVTHSQLPGVGLSSHLGAAGASVCATGMVSKLSVNPELLLQLHKSSADFQTLCVRRQHSLF